MKKFLFIAAGLLNALAAHSSVVYSNAPVNNSEANCRFSTVCAAQTLGDDVDVYASQHFTLTENTKINQASFALYLYALLPTDQPIAANWMFLDDDGAAGLPGTILAQGANAPIVQRTPTYRPVGSDYIDEYFNIPDIVLNAGSYYFAVQAISETFNTYLFRGVANTGAAETFDGGLTWHTTYENMNSVAFSLYDVPVNTQSVPEPGSLALLGLGAFVAWGLRKRLPGVGKTP